MSHRKYGWLDLKGAVHGRRVPGLTFMLPFLCLGIFLHISQYTKIERVFPSININAPTFFQSPFSTSQESNQPRSLDTYIHQLRQSSPDSLIRTNRTACREFWSGGQSCVFDGLTCLDLRPWSKGNTNGPSHIPVIFINEDKPDGMSVPHDNWCHLKHLIGDPRNGGPRAWNPENYTVAPRWSCLSAVWRKWDSLRNEVRNVKYIDEDLWVVDRDYIGGSGNSTKVPGGLTHNNHLLKDYVWMLDLLLWQKSLALSPHIAPFFPEKAHHVVFPGTYHAFKQTMDKDINKLIWALQLQLDLEPLYASYGGKIKSPQDSHSEWMSTRIANPLDEAYPSVFKDERMLFHFDFVNQANDSALWEQMKNGAALKELSPKVKGIAGSKEYDLICAPKLLVGAKLPGYGHQRVCQEMRMRSWDLFGIKEPKTERRGILVRAPAPKRIVIINRYRTRHIKDASRLYDELKTAFDPYGIEVELISTQDLKTAEANVRAYARAGVVISPHGSQSMSMMFMPRFTALIEVFPFAYRHYAFKFGAESCQLFHYEIYGKPDPRLTQEEYDYCLKHAGPLEMSACAVGNVKHVAISVDSQPVIEKTFLAFAKMGYDLRNVTLP
eukprot:Plantae.Rhodophyta-Hildenbrandia_rubra.ctg9444.p1 GENE.Plantae.Rhodophyta-Hildenbrandia_rubra.ctg9444~~Plantae.Rhodophyta-Hildenbrandia_rubra.ctg9444.p1  ORF type:complete len:609 (-),score=63.85 Plantae.Rhodophyta-Hildenbrandia_rubra.ctg9444:544-2370(-)